ncbi:hypothetical protein EUX98_g4386 [Antrodiella citrinella]|uniref:Uncharacterized protein n=1 Tax=Antrodiella citrinella TaxID=2447956 RepID=A0A4S4MU49_9APHY|nr:hypothetical protein EUX98_g4386 [Antrodiella citrinella]
MPEVVHATPIPEPVIPFMLQQSFYVQADAPSDPPDRSTAASHEDGHETRSRLHNLGLLGPDDTVNTSVTAREKELVEMVLQLSAVPQPEYTDQLAAQADTISGLIQQRAFLLQQREEDHSRWAAERESWKRTSDVLASKRRAAADITELDQEARRRIASVESDNYFLKQRLTDSQQKQVLLETELNRLRPLLLSQPIESLQYEFLFPTPPLYPPKPVPAKRKTKKEKEAEAEAERERLKEVAERQEREAAEKEEREKAAEKPCTEGGVEGETEKAANAQGTDATQKEGTPHTQSHDGETQIDLQAHPSGQPSGSQHYRLLKEREAAQRRKSAKSARHTTRGSSSAHSAMLVDARNELLLNAMRKVGRLKAGIQAGIVKMQEENTVRELAEAQEKEKEKEVKKRVRNRTAQKDHPSQTPGAGPSSQLLPAVFPTNPSNPQTPRRGSAPTNIPPPPPPTQQQQQHVQAFPQALHPSASMQQQSSHPTHQFVYISPVQASGRPYVQAVPAVQSVPPSNGMPMYVSYWPPPGTPAPVPSGTAGPSTPVPAQKEKDKPKRTRQRNRRRKDPLETVQNGSTTPMDSLVKAARSMLVEEEEQGENDRDVPDGVLLSEPDEPPAEPKKRRREGAKGVGGAVDAGSPQPKRRRVGTGTPTSLHPSTLLSTPHKGGPPPHSHTLAAMATSTPGRAASQISRTRSALDVLAETAQEQERRPDVPDTGSRRPSPEPRSNGGGIYSPAPSVGGSLKGKERATLDDPYDDAPRARSMSAVSIVPPGQALLRATPGSGANRVQRRSHDDDDDGESEVSAEDTEPEQQHRAAQRPQRHTATARGTHTQQQQQLYKPNKALHEFQFVPPSPQTVRTPSRPGNAPRAATDEPSPTSSKARREPWSQNGAPPDTAGSGVRTRDDKTLGTRKTASSASPFPDPAPAVFSETTTLGHGRPGDARSLSPTGSHPRTSSDSQTSQEKEIRPSGRGGDMHETVGADGGRPVLGATPSLGDAATQPTSSSVAAPDITVR